jgi:hypothetical protein
MKGIKGIERRVWKKFLPSRTSVPFALVSLFQVSLQRDSRVNRLCIAEPMSTGSVNLKISTQIDLGSKDSVVIITFISFIPVKNLGLSSTTGT